MNLTLITASLCWISVSVCEFHTVEVWPGEEVALLCSNFSRAPSHILWFRLANRRNASCISSMISSDSNALYCDGFQNGTFDMTSNTSYLFLRIKRVDLSDSGLYFCGFYSDGNTVIDSATYLKVQEVLDCDGITMLIAAILDALIAFLVTVVIALVVKIRKRHTAHEEGQDPQHSENLGSDSLNYAALSFHPKAKGRKAPASENQLESHVVYAAPR